jgi:hypothetical protein
MRAKNNTPFFAIGELLSQLIGWKINKKQNTQWAVLPAWINKNIQ